MLIMIINNKYKSYYYIILDNKKCYNKYYIYLEIKSSLNKELFAATALNILSITKHQKSMSVSCVR